MAELWSALNRELDVEIERQNLAMGGYQPTRNGLRLGIAHLEDEVREVHQAHRDERKVEGWGHTHQELIQVAAIAIRMAYSIQGQGLEPARVRSASEEDTE